MNRTENEKKEKKYKKQKNKRINSWVVIPIQPFLHRRHQSDTTVPCKPCIKPGITPQSLLKTTQKSGREAHFKRTHW